jgi:hypothetical protein
MTAILSVVIMLNTAVMFLPQPPMEVAQAAPTIDYSSYDYYVENLSVYMFVSPGGSAEFMEVMNFTFNRGTYSMAFREIPHEGFETLTNVNVVNDTGSSLSIGAAYQFDWFKGKYMIRWPFDPKTGPTNTTFFVSYATSGVATSVSKDQLGVDWNIVGKGWGVPIKRFNAYVYMFNNFSKSPLFKYYPKDANISIDKYTGGTLLRFNRTNIQPGKTVRVIVYYPKNITPQKSMDRLLRENSLMIAAAIFLIVFFLCLIFVLYRNVAGRLVPKTLRPNMNLARDPVKLTTLVQGKYSPMAFFAGIVHLSQMGFATIEDDRDSGEIWIKAREEGPDELSVPLLPHDGIMLSAVSEGPPQKSLHEVWNKAGKEIGETMLRDLARDGLFSRSSRFNISIFAVVVGAIMAAVPMVLLVLLIQVYTYYAVVYGGILLGVALAGIPVLVMLGFFTPRYTSRGALERSQLAANLESIAYQMDKASKENPDDVPAMFDKSASIMTAAPVQVKGGFPTFLRKLGSQSPDAPYHHPWYDSTAAPEEAPKGRSFGTFSLAYADTLDKVPHYFKGRTGERPEERPPVEGPGPDKDAFQSGAPHDDATAYHDLEAPAPKEPAQFELVSEPPKPKARSSRTRPPAPRDRQPKEGN